MTMATSGSPSVGQLLHVTAVAIVACAAVYAIAPFSISVPVGSVLTANGAHAGSSGGLSAERLNFSSTDCGAAVLGAWRADKAPSGWFGYAPLTSVPLISQTAGCRGASRRRLEFAFGGLVIGLALAIQARRTGRPAADGDTDH